MSKPDPAAVSPLFGFLPRKVTGVQIRKALVRYPAHPRVFDF